MQNYTLNFDINFKTTNNMLPSFNHAPTQNPKSGIGNPNRINERQFVYVADLMKVTGLGQYQAGKYFREIKNAAEIRFYVRSIHIDTFMEHLLTVCPTFSHITLNDMKMVLLS